MSIATETRVTAPALGDGVNDSFPFAFKVFKTSDVVVTQTTDLGIETTLTLGVHYNVTLNANQDVSPGGTVMTVAPLTDDYLLTISSAIPNLQGVKITNRGGFFPAIINNALDRVTILAQQISIRVDRAIKIPISDGTGVTTELPTKLLRANKALIFDVNGNVSVSPDNYVNQTAATAAYAGAAATSAGDALTARNAAVAAKTDAETARDDILDDAGFIAVAADLTGDNNIGAVAVNLADINTVAGDIADVAAVGSHITQVLAVHDDLTNIDNVAADLTVINTVAGIAANVTTVAGIAGNTTTVAGISVAVSNVSTNMASVVDVHDNMGAVIAAPGYALEAHHWANYPENSLVPEGNGSEYSAYHWAKKAESIVGGTPDAHDIDYDNSTSGLAAANVQDAIDEVANGSGGGGGGYASDDRLTEYFYWTAVKRNSSVPTEMIILANGVGAGFSMAGGVGYDESPYTTGSTSSANAGQLLWLHNQASTPPAGYKQDFSGKIITGQFLSDGTDTYWYTFALSNTPNADIAGTPGGDNIGFRYSHGNNSGRWEAITSSGGVTTVVDTGVTVSAQNLYYLRIVWTKGTGADFYINNTLVATITTNIAASHRTASLIITKTLGITAREIGSLMLKYEGGRNN